jgi:Flp pilus assembly protein TadD
MAPPVARAHWTRFLSHPAFGAAVAAFLLYLPALGGGYLRDDHYLIERHPYLRAGGWLVSLLLGDFWAPVSGATGMWRPLIVLSYWVDGRIAGWTPYWFHVVNAIAYGLATGALALVLVTRGLPRWAVWAAALGFAAMPAHAESVAWISGRTDIFCTLFALIALWLDARARTAGRSWPGVLAPASLALALLSKETAALLVAVLMVTAWCDERRPVSLARLALWLAPYAAVTLAYLAAHAAFAPDPGVLSVADAQSRLELRRTGWALLPGYIAFLWPWFPHSPDRAAPRFAPDWRLETALGGLALAGLLVALVFLIRRRARAAPALALFLGPLLPPLILASARGYGLFGERHVFLPSAGAAWLFALGLVGLASRRSSAGAAAAGVRPPALALGVAAVLIAGSAIETVRAFPAYRNDEQMYRTMTEREPGNPVGFVGLAGSLTARGELAKASALLDSAARIDPASATLRVGRASIAARREAWADALAEADRAIAVDPEYRPAQVMRALALLRLARLEEAGRSLAALRAQSPSDPEAATVWGQYLVARGRFAEAVPVLESAATLMPEDSGLWDALGMASARTGRRDEARAAFARAVELQPGYLEGWIRLAAVCQMMGDREGRDRALAQAAALPGGRERIAKMSPAAAHP